MSSVNQIFHSDNSNLTLQYGSAVPDSPKENRSNNIPLIEDLSDLCFKKLDAIDEEEQILFYSNCFIDSRFFLKVPNEQFSIFEYLLKKGPEFFRKCLLKNETFVGERNECTIILFLSYFSSFLARLSDESLQNYLSLFDEIIEKFQLLTLKNIKDVYAKLECNKRLACLTVAFRHAPAFESDDRTVVSQVMFGAYYSLQHSLQGANDHEISTVKSIVSHTINARIYFDQEKKVPTYSFFQQVLAHDKEAKKIRIKVPSEHFQSKKLFINYKQVEYKVPFSLIESLLKLGADPNLPATDGSIPQMSSILYYENNIDRNGSCFSIKVSDKYDPSLLELLENYGLKTDEKLLLTAIETLLDTTVEASFTHKVYRTVSSESLKVLLQRTSPETKKEALDLLKKRFQHWDTRLINDWIENDSLSDDIKIILGLLTQFSRFQMPCFITVIPPEQLIELFSMLDAESNWTAWELLSVELYISFILFHEAVGDSGLITLLKALSEKAKDDITQKEFKTICDYLSHPTFPFKHLLRKFLRYFKPQTLTTAFIVENCLNLGFLYDYEGWKSRIPNSPEKNIVEQNREEIVQDIIIGRSLKLPHIQQLFKNSRDSLPSGQVLYRNFPDYLNEKILEFLQMIDKLPDSLKHLFISILIEEKKPTILAEELFNNPELLDSFIIEIFGIRSIDYSSNGKVVPAINKRLIILFSIIRGHLSIDESLKNEIVHALRTQKPIEDSIPMIDAIPRITDKALRVLGRTAFVPDGNGGARAYKFYRNGENFSRFTREGPVTEVMKKHTTTFRSAFHNPKGLVRVKFVPPQLLKALQLTKNRDHAPHLVYTYTTENIKALTTYLDEDCEECDFTEGLERFIHDSCQLIRMGLYPELAEMNHNEEDDRRYHPILGGNSAGRLADFEAGSAHSNGRCSGWTDCGDLNKVEIDDHQQSLSHSNELSRLLLLVMMFYLKRLKAQGKQLDWESADQIKYLVSKLQSTVASIVSYYSHKPFHKCLTLIEKCKKTPFEYIAKQFLFFSNSDAYGPYIAKGEVPNGLYSPDVMANFSGARLAKNWHQDKQKLSLNRRGLDFGTFNGPLGMEIEVLFGAMSFLAVVLAQCQHSDS
ncbi:MAG: hypothetical protein H7A37_01510 [Chlamydiales bacterium]|nr:hypothetical protein [Chlamydiia bacterium]MCP5506970.1 hypothetical protein [Chlamydiales bacterium]